MRNRLLKISLAITAFGMAVCVVANLPIMSSKQPKVVLVYTQKEPIPDIVFKISSIPLALASYIKFGSVVFAAIPATDKNILRSLSEAEFVVVGTHGWDGRLYSDDRSWIGPSKTPNLKMREIYFGSCFFGAKRKAWEAMFPNAIVSGYDSETYQVTGWIYLVFKSWIDLFTVNFTG